MGPNSEPSPLALGPPQHAPTRAPIRQVVTSQSGQPEVDALTHSPGPSRTTALGSVASLDEQQGHRKMPRLRKKSSSRFSSIPGKASSAMSPPVFAEARFCTPRLTVGPPILNKLDILRLFLRRRPPNTPNFMVASDWRKPSCSSFIWSCDLLSAFLSCWELYPACCRAALS